LIVAPEPIARAGAIDRLRADPAEASAMGERAYATLDAKQISWDNVVGSLLA
jgi:hypothetical protein